MLNICEKIRHLKQSKIPMDAKILANIKTMKTMKKKMMVNSLTVLVGGGGDPVR